MEAWQHLYLCDKYSAELETQKLFVGAVAWNTIDSSTRTVITYQMSCRVFVSLLFCQPTQILQEKWCFCFQNNGNSDVTNVSLFWCIQNSLSTSLHTLSVDVLLTRSVPCNVSINCVIIRHADVKHLC